MYIEYNNQKYIIEVVRKNNKNTYIRVKDNKIVITTHYLATNRYLEKLIKTNYKSITKMIDKSTKKDIDKDIFKLFGKHYQIIYNENINKIQIEDNIIYTKDEKIFNTWLNNYIKQTFTNHLEYNFNLFKEKIPKPTLKIRTMKSRWGVCNTKTHNITLNKELYRYEIECLDYVCIHELSHLIEPNHSKAFWNIVSKYCQNYKEIRKRLRG